MLDSKTLKQLSHCPHDLGKGTAKDAKVGSPDYTMALFGWISRALTH